MRCAEAAQIQIVAFEGCAEQTNFPSDCYYWALMCYLLRQDFTIVQAVLTLTILLSKPPLCCNYNQTYNPAIPNLAPELFYFKYKSHSPSL